MKKFMDDLQKAVENGSIQVTGTKADTYADFEISPQQILIATKDNVDYIVQKLRSSNQGYIVIYKYCEAVYVEKQGEKTKMVSDTQDVKYKISLSESLKELHKFDEEKLFPYLKRLFEELERLVDPSPMVF